jgi:hypothetical protein
MAGGAIGSDDDSRTVPREYGNEIYVLSVPIRSPTACHMDWQTAIMIMSAGSQPATRDEYRKYE